VLKRMEKGVSVRLAMGLLGLSLVTGCSSDTERKQANRDFDYTQEKLAPASLKIPQGLQAPEFSNDYRIPPLRQADQPRLLGSQVDVRPPVQILNLTPGSRGEFSQEAVSLWFSPRSVNQKLDQELWELLFSFLTERNIPVASLDPDSKRLDTNWFATTPTMATWTDESDDKLKLRQRYRFSLENDPGLHRTALKLQLLQQESYLDGEKRAEPLSHLEQRRYAVQLMNQLSAYIEKSLSRGNSQEQADRIPLLLGLDGNGLTAWLAGAGFEPTWQRLSAVLPGLGFTLTSKQESLGLIVADYEDPDSHFWQFGQQSGFGLASGSYRLQLGDLGDKTSITLFDADKKPVDKAVVSKMYLSLAKAFSRSPAAAKPAK